MTSIVWRSIKRGYKDSFVTSFAVSASGVFSSSSIIGTSFVVLVGCVIIRLARPAADVADDVEYERVKGGIGAGSCCSAP